MTIKNTDKNILFFFTDDQRFDTIKALGNNEIITPNLDKLAQQGTVFTQAHIPCGTAAAVCMPSRAMLNTGRTLFHLEGAGENIPQDHTLLGETLQKSGYNCFGAGKWHNGTSSYARSFNVGAEIYFGGMFDHWNVPACDFAPTGKYVSRCYQTTDFVKQRVAEQCYDHIHAGKHSSELFCDAAINYLEDYKEDNPFYMYISFMAPHDPRTMPRKYLDMYDPTKISLPKNFMPEHPFDTGAIRIRDEMLAEFPRTPEEIRKHIAAYYAMITHLDAQIGRVMKALEEKGELENTIIILSGDNGLAIGQHGLMGKQNCYEHSVRVPLIFSGPGIPAGERRDAFVYLFDIFPTLCELIGIDIPASVEGQSLLRAINDPDEKVRDNLYFAYCDKQRAVKDRSHKLIEYVIDGKHAMTQFFDLEHDPWELNNLAGSSASRKKLEQMRQELNCYAEQWDDRKSQFGQPFWQIYSQSSNVPLSACYNTFKKEEA